MDNSVTAILPSFILLANGWGLINSYGSFHGFYRSSVLQSDEKSITYVGYLAAFIVVVTLAALRQSTNGRPTLLILLGSLFLFLATALTSVSTRQWHFIVAQALINGGGSGMLFTAALNLVGITVTAKPRVAISLALLGANCGGIVYPLTFDILRSHVGVMRAARSVTAIALGTNAIAFMLVRHEARTNTTGHLARLKRCRYPANLTYFDISRFMLGLFIPYYHLQQFAKCQCYPNWDASIMTLLAANVGSVLGRVSLGVLPDVVQEDIPWKVFCYIYTCLFSLAWFLSRDSPVGLAIFCGLYGFITAAFVPLPYPAPTTDDSVEHAD